MNGNKNISYEEAREKLLSKVSSVGIEQVDLALCTGRVLAQSVKASDNVPPFDRSPYDGYALASADIAQASKDHPVSLRVLEEVPAGCVAHYPVTSGMAVKIMTGAPIPDGADTVVMFEKTDFTADRVTFFAPSQPGQNIVKAGEDIRKGKVLAEPGMVIDPGLLGVMSSENLMHPSVYKIPKVGIISTGSELVEVGEKLGPGMIYNTNRYTFTAILNNLACEPIYFGTGADKVDEISNLLEKALASCDAVLTTGGVSVGDYDLTPDAMVQVGAEILFKGVAMKPGMACAYGWVQGKPILGLSGNPASSVTNFYAIALPAIRKLCGYKEIYAEEIELTLAVDFHKSSPITRFLRGKLDLTDGKVRMDLSKYQGNVVLSSLIACDVMAVIPAGSGPLKKGSRLKGFLI